VIENHSARNIKKYSSLYQLVVRDPIFGTEIPVIREDQVLNHMMPEERLSEIVMKPLDSLEELVVDIVEFIQENSGISVKYMGITGPILGRFHNIVLTNIALVIYGCENAQAYVESCSSVLKPIPRDKLSRWAISTSKIHGIPINDVFNLYRPYRRFLFRNKEVYVIMVDPRPERYGEKIFVNLSPIKVRAYVQPRQCSALLYPSRVIIDKYQVMSESINLKFRIIEVTSYEYIYSPLLYEGGELIIEGLLQLVLPHNYYRILVGGSEHPGFVKRL